MGCPLPTPAGEIYDKMVELRLELRREKRQLAELDLLFGCCKRVLENAGETAFLVGAEFSALQAGERVAGAERAVEQSLHLARALESNLQFPSLHKRCLRCKNHMKSLKSQHMKRQFVILKRLMIKSKKKLKLNLWKKTVFCWKSAKVKGFGMNWMKKNCSLMEEEWRRKMMGRKDTGFQHSDLQTPLILSESIRQQVSCLG